MWKWQLEWKIRRLRQLFFSIECEEQNTNYPISFFPASLSLLCVNWNTIGNYPSIIHLIRWARTKTNLTQAYWRAPNERWKHYSTWQASKHDTNVRGMRTLAPNTECLQNKWSFHVVSAALHRCTLASLGLRGMHLDSPAGQTRFYPFIIATQCHRRWFGGAKCECCERTEFVSRMLFSTHGFVSISGEETMTDRSDSPPCSVMHCKQFVRSRVCGIVRTTPKCSGCYTHNRIYIKNHTLYATAVL